MRFPLQTFYLIQKWLFFNKYVGALILLELLAIKATEFLGISLIKKNLLDLIFNRLFFNIILISTISTEIFKVEC